MPTSSYMPDVKVEIAFDGGFRVPMTDWTWTDVSDYVELGDGISGFWGRQDERSTADANTLTLTLDNSDGRFTAGRVTSPYYPNVKLYKPIRLKLDPVDGGEQTWHVGYVTSWPVEWEGASAYAKATITASSRLSRLGLNARWRSIVEEVILADSPMAYYPLSEPEGAVRAHDASGNSAAPLTQAGAGVPVEFGQATGPATDGLTAATFAGGTYLTGGTMSIPADSAWSIECFILASAVPSATDVTLVAIRGDNYSPEAALKMSNAGGLYLVYSRAPTVIGSATNYADDRTHHVVGVSDGGATIRLYVDGVEVATNGAVTLTHPAITNLSVGGRANGDAVFSGVVAHAAAYSSELSPTRVAAHHESGVTAWAGDTTDARFRRYAELAGIPATEIIAEAGSTTMAHVDTTGQNIVDMLRLVEDTEAGVMFDDRDGTLTLHSRAHRYAATTAVTLDMAEDEVESDYAPRLDPSALVNDVTATNQGGTVTAHLKDRDSIEANGFANTSIATASEDDYEPQNLAGWALYKYADPKPRVPSLTVNALAQVGKAVTCADVMAVTLGDKIAVANHPSQAAYSISAYFVEGGSFAIGPESLTISWNLSPTDAEDAVLVLDSATQGLLDTNVLAL